MTCRLWQFRGFAWLCRPAPVGLGRNPANQQQAKMSTTTKIHKKSHLHLADATRSIAAEISDAANELIQTLGFPHRSSSRLFTPSASAYAASNLQI